MAVVDLWLGDCEKLMKNIPDNSIQMIFSDFPYGTTQNKWDCCINLDIFWKEAKRILKKNGVVALWAQAPFSHVLACSNLDWYRYEWVIEKTKATGHLNAKKMPMKAHENILIFSEEERMASQEDNADEPLSTTIQIFYQKLPPYHPQMTSGHAPVHNYTKHTDDGSCYGKTSAGVSGGGSTQRYPRDVLQFSWDTQKSHLHPCQKPLEACKYFIQTYTSENDNVLDVCMGSNSTGIACAELNRNYLGIEKDPDIYNVAVKRTNEACAS